MCPVLLTRTKQRGRVGNTLDGKVDTDEVTHGLTVMDGIFKRFIGQSVPLLKEIDPQHPFQTNRWPTALAPADLRKQDGDNALIRRCHGIRASICAGNRSRRVIFFLFWCSA